MIPQEIKAFIDPTNESLVWMLMQFQLIQTLVQHLHCFPILPSGSTQDQNIVHVTNIETIPILEQLIQLLQVQCTE